MENGEPQEGLLQTLIARAKAETPLFFKKVRLTGLLLAAIGTVLMTSPVPLPTTLISIGGYLIVAGGILSAVSQLTVKDESEIN